jgi:hypothetical protein
MRQAGRSRGRRSSWPAARGPACGR